MTGKSCPRTQGALRCQEVKQVTCGHLPVTTHTWPIKGRGSGSAQRGYLTGWVPGDLS